MLYVYSEINLRKFKKSKKLKTSWTFLWLNYIYNKSI